MKVEGWLMDKDTMLSVSETPGLRTYEIVFELENVQSIMYDAVAGFSHITLKTDPWGIILTRTDISQIADYLNRFDRKVED